MEVRAKARIGAGRVGAQGARGEVERSTSDSQRKPSLGCLIAISKESHEEAHKTDERERIDTAGQSRILSVLGGWLASFAARHWVVGEEEMVIEAIDDLFQCVKGSSSKVGSLSMLPSDCCC